MAAPPIFSMQRWRRLPGPVACWLQHSTCVFSERSKCRWCIHLCCQQFVTADLISRGRFGVNIVCGWNQDEFEMFGAEQRDHDARYEYADEWLTVIERLWSNPNPIDFDGRYFKLKVQ